MVPATQTFRFGPSCICCESSLRGRCEGSGDAVWTARSVGALSRKATSCAPTAEITSSRDSGLRMRMVAAERRRRTDLRSVGGLALGSSRYVQPDEDPVHARGGPRPRGGDDHRPPPPGRRGCHLWNRSRGLHAFGLSSRLARGKGERGEPTVSVIGPCEVALQSAAGALESVGPRPYGSGTCGAPGARTRAVA